MAHFAQLDDDNIVVQVIVVSNYDILDETGSENEEIGIQFCKNLLGLNTRWVQTSYNSTFRKRYGRPGYTYDSIRDAFIPPKPFNSWVLNEQTYDWESPIPYPTDGQEYYWNEDNLDWELVE